MSDSRSVALVTLGCVRNEVDSSELAGRLTAAGWTLVDDAADADVAVVNTCGFVEAAKKDSVDALLEASDLKEHGRTRAVVAVGCMAERYGTELADALPEADAVLGFDSYPELAAHLDEVLSGHRPAAHVPRDRRTLLPISPVERQAARVDAPDLPLNLAPASGPQVTRRLLDGRPWAPLKLASGCDRRCSFCAIPSFRGAFVSRHPDEIVDEAHWLAEQGIREIFLVSENTTSYGKDLSDLRALEGLLPRLSAVDGLERIRVSYLQPAEVRPGLIEVIAGTDKVAGYYDLSFQHSSAAVLRRMRRFGDTDSFLGLIERIRTLDPTAGIRSNVIVGFPGETAADLAELHRFVTEARLDVVGVFGYSDEDGTEAADLDGKLPTEEIEERLAVTTDLVEELSAQRAEDRVGEQVVVLVEELDEHGVSGRGAHQGPEVDGTTSVYWSTRSMASETASDTGSETGSETGPDTRSETGLDAVAIGDFVTATVTGSEGVDLIATVTARGATDGA